MEDKLKEKIFRITKIICELNAENVQLKKEIEIYKKLLFKEVMDEL